MTNLPRIRLQSCPKGYHKDLDKAISPAETCARVLERLSQTDLDLVSEVRRIDSGRLGIPVYLSVCGSDAREIIPARKQMGKGSSPDQARASALMELMERFAFFSFWQRQGQFRQARWQEARRLFQKNLIPLSDILLSVNDGLSPAIAEELLNLVSWSFYPSTRLNDESIVWLPLDWFRMLGEFNGSSAGNTAEESILQGIGELVERHVSCITDREKKVLPSLSLAGCEDRKLLDLVDAFRKNGIQLILKDMSLGMPLPTVAALAWDPATFPENSEIVFTAGTASSPEKAAIRAITEVAQLAGDFHSKACYEASGLSKYSTLEKCSWILQGPESALSQMPSLENEDIREEIRNCLAALSPLSIYAVETTHPLLRIPAHYCIAPGLQFRERASNQSLGLFIGRKLAEESPFREAMQGLDSMGKYLPDAPYLPFFRGLALLKHDRPDEAIDLFKAAIPLQQDAEAAAMSEFYTAYALSKMDAWKEAAPLLESAIDHSGDVKEYHNLLGVALFKTGKYAEAEQAFSQALELDKGSAMDLANRGICRKLQGKKARAMEDLRSALELDPALDFAARHLEELLHS